MRDRRCHQLSYLLIVLIAVTLAGCSSSREATPDPPQKRSVPTEEARDIALHHFVEGTVLQLKGEHANAVLEFQDALRYDDDPAVFFALSRSYSSLGKHPLAAEAARHAVNRKPENSEYRRNLATIHMAAYDIDTAIKEFEALLKVDSSHIEDWYNLGRLYQTRSPRKALEVYERILSQFGPDWGVLAQRAELLNALGEFSKAAESLEAMLELDPGNIELRRNIAQVHARAGDVEKAHEMYLSILEQDSNNVEVIGELAGILLFNKQYVAAASLAERILLPDSIDIELKLRVGEAYLAQLQKDSTLAEETIKVLETVKRAEPGDWRTYWFLGAAGVVSGRDSLVESSFRRVTELSNTNPDGWVYLSSHYLEKENFQEAVTVLERAIKILPEEFRIHFFLGVAYNRLGRLDDAVRSLERARSINRKDVGAMSQLALVYDGMKRHEESDKLYEEALAIEPENSVVLNNFSYSLAERSIQLDRALRMSQKAVEADPENSAYLDTFGWIYYRLGRYDEAERYVRMAIERGGASAVVYEHLGDIYYKQNEVERAMEQWNIALKMDESNASLRGKISRGSL